MLENECMYEEGEEEESEEWSRPLEEIVGGQFPFSVQWSHGTTFPLPFDANLPPEQSVAPHPQPTPQGTTSGVQSAPLLSRMQLNDNKAGMGNLDKEQINKIIYEMSKGQ